MLIFTRRSWAALTVLALVGATVLPRVSVPAEPTAQVPKNAVTARRLDLGDRQTLGLADDLRQDLGPLLAAAQYRRGKDDPDAPRHSITSVRRIVEALRAHGGVAYVALAERENAGDGVTLDTLYVLEGAPIGAAGASDASEATPARGAFQLDLGGDSAKSLVASLHGHLGALLPPAGQGSPSAVEDVIAALEQYPKVAYVVLAERTGEAAVDLGQVFVAPDVERISISDDAAPSALEASPEAAPEVEMIPAKDGEPAKIKFEFDPEKYDITKQK